MAFTGNKFEFRMLGASQSVAGPNIALNTIMAEELEQFADILEKSEDFGEDLQKLIRKTFSEHQHIIFNGNGYDEAWLQEAEKRGLCNLPSTAEALPAYLAPKNVELFTKHGIYTRQEMTARGEIHIEHYSTVIAIEVNTMADMIRHDILPAVSAWGDALCQRIYHKKSLNIPCHYEETTAAEVCALTDGLMAACDKLQADLAARPAGGTAAMRYSRDVLVPDMAEARRIADRLEVITDAKYWPFPTYSEMLYYL
jgi:glutamine synthetase